jgi:hypothetical protein
MVNKVKNQQSVRISWESYKKVKDKALAEDTSIKDVIEEELKKSSGAEELSGDELIDFLVTLPEIGHNRAVWIAEELSNRDDIAFIKK